MSIPNRVAAPPMKASCVASVTTPNTDAPRIPNALEMRTFVARVART